MNQEAIGQSGYLSVSFFVCRTEGLKKSREDRILKGPIEKK